MASTANLSPAALQLRQQQVEHQRVQEGVITGALIGGLIGAGLGAAFGGSNRGQAALLGGLVGAGAGAATGGAYAQNVNQQTRAASADQDASRRTIESADASIASFRRQNATVARITSEEERKIAGLNSRYRAGQLTAAQYRTEIAGTGEYMSLLQSTRNDMDRDITALDNAVSNGNAEARGRAAALRQEKARLETQISRLRNAYDRIPRDVGGVS